MSSISPADVVFDASTGLIAVVLLISGIAKLPASDRTLQAIVDLGLPAWLQQRWIAIVLPVAELAIAVALLLGPVPLRFLGALAAAAMMLGFTAIVIRAVATGIDASCECFGAFSRDELDGWTIGRNAVLTVAAIAAASAGPDAPGLLFALVDRSSAELTLLVVIWVALAIIALLLRWALAQRAEARSLRADLSGLSSSGDGTAVTPTAAVAPASVGDLIPDAELVNSSGATLSLRRLDRGRAVLLVFMTSGCGKCAAAARAFPEWKERIGSTVTLRVATSSRPEQLAEKYPEIGDHARFGAKAAKAALGVARLPSAVLLGADGKIATPVAEGIDQIEALVNGIVEAQSTLREGRYLP